MTVRFLLPSAQVVATALCCFLLNAGAQAQTVLKDKLVTALLTDGLTIAESHETLVGKASPSSDSPNRGSLLVRLYLLGKGGECVEPSPAGCPKVKLLVAVKNLLQVDMPGVPTARVYQIDGGYGWEFADWKTFSRDVFDRNSFTVFQMRKRVIAKDIAYWRGHHDKSTLDDALRSHTDLQRRDGDGCGDCICQSGKCPTMRLGHRVGEAGRGTN